MLVFQFFSDFIHQMNTDIALNIINGIKWICNFLCIFFVILYSCGVKKAGVYSTVTFVIYFLSQCCKCGIK